MQVLRREEGDDRFICVSDVTRFIISPERNSRVKIALPSGQHTDTLKRTHTDK